MTTEVAERPAATKAPVLFRLWPKQMYAFNLVFEHGIDQLLFGGAGGGGKSQFERIVACYVAKAWPGSQFAIFRRTDSQLRENHTKKWLTDIHPYIGGKFFVQQMEYIWPTPEWCWCPKRDKNGLAICAHSSQTLFRHVDAEHGVQKHQGAAYAAQGSDEATLLSGPDNEYLFTRVRSEDNEYAKKIPGPDGREYDYPGWPGYHRLQILTANPGGVGQDWCYANFIDPMDGLERFPEQWEDKKIIGGPHPLTNSRGQQVWTEYGEDLRGNEIEIEVDMRGGQRWTVEIDLPEGLGKETLTRAFVPAKVRDNPAVDAKRAAGQMAMGSAEQRRRFLEGDWSYAEDKVFKVLEPDIHQVNPEWVFGPSLRPPLSWPRGIGQDHGTTKPTACAWVTLEEEGFIICYQEYYKPGPIGEHVVAIRDLMLKDGHPELTLAGDPRIMHRNQGVKQQISVADIYRHGGEPAGTAGERRVQMREAGIRIKPSRITDEAALTALADLLEPDPNRIFPDWHPKRGQGGAPMLFFTTNVRAIWRELQNLRHPEIEEDGRYGEGIKDGQPDHGFDALKRIAGPFHQRIARGRRALGRFQLR